MIYVCSDIHGKFGKYKRLLEKINLTDNDTLYILGDVVDRGKDGMKILLDIAARENVILVRGNHDDLALLILQRMSEVDASDDKVLAAKMQIWCAIGGKQTLKQYLALSDEDKKIVLNVITSSKLFHEITVGGVNYILTHSVPEKKLFKDIASCEAFDLLWGEPDYNDEYYADRVIVTGHNITEFIGKEYAGKIYIKHNHIAVDCGAAYGYPLGCIRLDDMKEFYIK